MLESANDLISTTDDLLTFQRALIAGEPFERQTTTALLTERSNLLRNMIPNRYGPGTWILRLGRLMAAPCAPGTAERVQQPGRAGSLLRGSTGARRLRPRLSTSVSAGQVAGASPRSTRRSSWALRATMMVDRLIRAAPRAIGRMNPTGASTPAARGRAARL